MPHPGLRCVAVVALTVQSWANDIASHLADMLGYGQQSTRALAIDITGHRVGTLHRQWRATAHDYLMSDRPSKRVWSHWDHTGPLRLDRPPRDGAFQVYVRESDALLEEAANRTGVATLEELAHARQESERIAKELPSTLVVSMDPFPIDVRAVRWAQTLLATAEILRWLDSLELIDGPKLVETLERRHDRSATESSSRAVAIARWLTRHGWPV